MAEVYTIRDLQAYKARFGEAPQVGHYITDGERAGVVVEVLDCYTVKVAWRERRREAQPRRKTVRRADTAAKYGLAWLLSQDTMAAVNAAYVE